MINLEKGFKRLAIVAMPVWFVVYGYFTNDYYGDFESKIAIFVFLVTFCFVNPLTLFYFCKFLVDGFRDDD